jgi:hypothetical protein
MKALLAQVDILYQCVCEQHKVKTLQIWVLSGYLVHRTHSSIREVLSLKCGASAAHMQGALSVRMLLCSTLRYTDE